MFCNSNPDKPQGVIIAWCHSSIQLKFVESMSDQEVETDHQLRLARRINRAV
jgi:hypothetical protein